MYRKKFHRYFEQRRVTRIHWKSSFIWVGFNPLCLPNGSGILWQKSITVVSFRYFPILEGICSHTRNSEVLELASEKHHQCQSHTSYNSQTQTSRQYCMAAPESHYSEHILKFLLHSERTLKPYNISELFFGHILRSPLGKFL